MHIVVSGIKETPIFTLGNSYKKKKKKKNAFIEIIILKKNCRIDTLAHYVYKSSFHKCAMGFHLAQNNNQSIAITQPVKLFVRQSNYFASSPLTSLWLGCKVNSPETLYTRDLHYEILLKVRAKVARCEDVNCIWINCYLLFEKC